MGRSGSSRYAICHPCSRFQGVDPIFAQTGLVKSKFVEAIQNYQTVEQQYRQKYKQRLERKYKIVKPDATQEEIRAVVEDDSGGQVFSQAVRVHLDLFFCAGEWCIVASLIPFCSF